MVTSFVKAMKSQPSHFVKKLAEMTKVALPPSTSRRKALALAYWGLIDHFIGIWTSPKIVVTWIEKNCNALIKGSLNQYLCGRGFFTFLFKLKEDKDLIFKTKPYFLGARGIYLNKWTPDFIPENNVLSTVPMWVQLQLVTSSPSLLEWWCPSLHGNSIGCHIDWAEPKENVFSCARICVEVDLEKGIPEAVVISLYKWKHVQQLDYE